MDETAISKNGVPIHLAAERRAHITMAAVTLDEYIRMIPAVKHSPKRYLWSSYDAEADVLYVNFKKPSHADDSELTDNDIILRYEQGEIVGLTILNASKRVPGSVEKQET